MNGMRLILELNWIFNNFFFYWMFVLGSDVKVLINKLIKWSKLDVIFYFCFMMLGVVMMNEEWFFVCVVLFIIYFLCCFLKFVSLLEKLF